MFKFIKIRHDIIKQCHGNYKEMKKFNYKLEIEIFRNSTQKIWVSWGVLFKGLVVQKGTQTPCWLRPCSVEIVEPFVINKLVCFRWIFLCMSTDWTPWRRSFPMSTTGKNTFTRTVIEIHFFPIQSLRFLFSILIISIFDFEELH